MDQRRDVLTPRTSMMGSKPVITPPRSVGTTTPYGGAYNNAPSEFSDLDLALQQRLLEIDRPKSAVGYNMPELVFDGTRSKTSPPGIRADRASVRTSPGTRDAEKDMSSYKKGFNFAKVPTSLSDGTSTKRVAAMISHPEKSLDAQQSSYAIERFLKCHGKVDVWTRGRSESKLLDADPNFHSFQDFKHVQSCDVFITIMNSAWASSHRCQQELELARKVHLTSTERNATSPGAPRRPIIVVIILKDEHARDFDPLDPTHPLYNELQHMPSVGHTILVHPSRRITGAELGSTDETSRWDEAAKATMQALRQACVEGGLGSALDSDIPGAPELFAPPFKAEYVSVDAVATQAKTAHELAAEAAAAVQKLALAVQAMAAPPQSHLPQVTVLRGGPGLAVHSSARANGVHPAAAAAAAAAVVVTPPPRPSPADPAMPWNGQLASRYMGTLTHMLGGRMVWSLDISFEQPMMAAELEEGELVTGIPGKVRYTLLNYFPNERRPDPATAYWSKWCAVRIGHEAVETLRCEFDPVQGLVLGDGVSVDQQNSFEDGEGALINPYQKYRMVLSHDGSLVGTLLAGGDWDAVFRASPF